MSLSCDQAERDLALGPFEVLTSIRLTKALMPGLPSFIQALVG
jgi:hypothetical protein